MKFAEGISYPFEKAHYSWRVLASESEKRRLLTPASYPASTRDSSWAYEQAFAEAPEDWHPLERASFADTRVWMTNMGNLQSDTFSMSSSLELRPTLLENELAQFLFSLPLSVKMRGFRTKDFFRRSYRGVLPSYITGQGKMGFHLPMAEWLRGELKDFASERLFSGADSARFFDRVELERLFAAHQSGSVDNSFRIFSIICFLEWINRFRGLVKT
jgi:asparagine synthase (glutamine-hydrolysing)